jgi:two-component system NtrC family sensor kinase
MNFFSRLRFAAKTFVHADRLRGLDQVVEELRLSRQQLLHSRNTLRALFDSSPTSIYIVDRGYVLVAINRGRADLAGETPQRLVGKSCHQALFERAQVCPGCQVGETLSNGQHTRRIERRQKLAGETAELEISTYPIFGEAGGVVQAFLFEEDVTERRQLEASLVQAEKMAAVGQLAAGVAHEINNPLTAILANAQLLQRDLPPDDRDQRDMAGTIIHAAERASQAVRDLLDFSRPERDELAATDVNDTVRRTLILIRHELLAMSIDLIFDPEEDLPAVNGNRDQLQSLWLNLIINAKQAIEPRRGEIRITTRRAGGAAQVIISDTGQGILPEQLPHIFEPFYTTKEPDRGTGLGLSICHRIVSQHGGQIQVNSEPGAGTQFTVTLPLSFPITGSK